MRVLAKESKVDHPAREQLQRFALGELADAEMDAIALHLLRGCSRCRSEVEPYFSSILDEPDPGPAPQELDAYDRAIEAAFSTVRLHGAGAVQVRKRTHRILAELRAGDVPELPPPSAPLTATSSRTLGRYPLFDAALRHSWELRRDDPARMIQLTRFAARLAPMLAEEGYSPAQIADFQARAWAELANAYRIADEPVRADEAMAAAFEHLARGTGDELLEARLLSLQASVHASRGRYRATLELLSRLRSVHLRRGDRHNAGRALIQASHYLGHWAFSAAALRAVEEGMAMIDPRIEPDLLLLGIQNRIDLLVDCGRFEEASGQLRLHRSRLRTGLGQLDRLRLKVTEGRLEVALGDLDRAAKAFVTAQRGFLDKGSRRMAALGELELAAVRLRQGRLNEARPLIEEALGELAAMDATGEAVYELKVLRASTGAEAMTISAAQVQALANVLRRSGRSPA
ncbi:MAG: hypothetical protein JOZ15_14050 [Acidobacteria bacterium]|nr:hypothetical protein [Acidobacteriota bacterium]